MASTTLLFLVLAIGGVVSRTIPQCPPIDAPPHCTAASSRRAITCHRIADPLPLLPLLSARRERSGGQQEDSVEDADNSAPEGQGSGAGGRERRRAEEAMLAGRRSEVKAELVRSITFCAYPDDIIDLGPIIKEFPELRRLTVAPGSMVSHVVGFDLEDEAGASSSSSSSEETHGAALLRLSASSLSHSNISAIMGPMEPEEEERLMRLLRRRRLRSLDLSGNRLRTLESGRWIRRVHKIYLAV